MHTQNIKLLIILALITLCQPYELTKADSKELLILNEVQQVYTFCRYHTLQYEIDLKGITNIKTKLVEAIELLNELCKNVHLSYVCSPLIKEIDTLFDNLKQQSKMIKTSKIRPEDQRMGSMLNIIERTVILVDATYYNLKQGIEKMQSLVNFFAKKQSRLQDQMEYNIQFDSLAQLTTVNLRKGISLFQSMIEIFIHKNFKHITDIVPTETLKKDITNILHKSRNESCKIPVTTKGTYIHEILHASDIKSFETTYSYAIEIKIPTTNEHSFTLTQGIPLPFAYKNESFELVTPHEYYLIRQETARSPVYAIPLSADEKRNCRATLDRVVCFPEQAMQVTGERVRERFFIPQYTLCTFMTLENMIMKPHECRLQRVHHTNQIIQLSPSSYFIYIVTNDSVRITCNQQQTDRVLYEPMKLTNLSPHCTLEIKERYFPEHATEPSNKIRKFAFPMLIPAILHPDLTEKRTNAFEFQPMQDFQPDFADVQDELQQVKLETTTGPTIERVDNSIETTMLITFYGSLLISLCAIGLYCRYEKRPQRQYSVRRVSNTTNTIEL